MNDGGRRAPSARNNVPGLAATDAGESRWAPIIFPLLCSRYSSRGFASGPGAASGRVGAGPGSASVVRPAHLARRSSQAIDGDARQGFARNGAWTLKCAYYSGHSRQHLTGVQSPCDVLIGCVPLETHGVSCLLAMGNLEGGSCLNTGTSASGLGWSAWPGRQRSSLSRYAGMWVAHPP